MLVFDRYVFFTNISLLLVFLSDDFVVYKNIVLDTSIKYDRYQNLDSAEMACRNDTECIGIYDENCDEDGPFLPIRSFFMDIKYQPNCIYKKRSYEGKK